MSSNNVTPLSNKFVLGSVWIPVDHSYLPEVDGRRKMAEGPYAFWYSNIGTEQKFTNSYVSVNRGKVSLTRKNINGIPIFYLKEFQVPDGWPSSVSVVIVSYHHSFIVGWLDYNCNKPVVNCICEVDHWAGDHVSVGERRGNLEITSASLPGWKLTISYENGKFVSSVRSRTGRT